MAAKTLVTTFDDVHEAERAVQKLQQDGFAPEGLGWVAHSADGSEIAHGNLVETRDGSSVAHTVIGALLGALAGLLCGITAVTIAGFADRLVMIGAAVVGALLGLAVGAAVAGRVDAVARTRVPRERAHRYAERLGTRAARVMVTVDDEEEEARALEIIRGEASLHKHSFSWRVPPLTDDQRPSRQYLA
jgi:hypothetical protein